MTGEPRDMTEADIPALDALLGAAYGTPGSHERRLREGYASGATRTFVVDVDGAPAGMATLHDYDTMGYVALLGVLPQRQRLGIGRRIMEAVMAESERRGHTTLALESSDAGRRLYDELGFATLAMTRFFEGPPAVAPIDHEHVRRATPDDAAFICAYDAVAFGGNRSASLLPFFAQPDRAVFIADDGHVIAGYAVASGNRVGPLLAQTPGAAAALLDAACEALGTPTIRMAVPEENSSALALVARRGWKPIGRNAHMVRGATTHVPRRAIYALKSLGEG